jgi:hypothetical protein
MERLKLQQQADLARDFVKAFEHTFEGDWQYSRQMAEGVEDFFNDRITGWESRNELLLAYRVLKTSLASGGSPCSCGGCQHKPKP